MRSMTASIATIALLLLPGAGPAFADEIKVAAAGDIADDPDISSTSAQYEPQIATASLIDAFTGLDYVFSLGDNQYEFGNGQDFDCALDDVADTKDDSNQTSPPGGEDCGSYHENEMFSSATFGDHAWGDFESASGVSTNPVAGNHEWENSAGKLYANIDGYLSYFGEGSVTNPSGDPWYRKTIETGTNDWTWYFLDSSTCNEQEAAGNPDDADVSRCQDGGDQYEWLESQLNGDQDDCVGASFHTPLFSSLGPDEADMGDIYSLLDTGGGADLVLTGHRHSYEVFGAQTANGTDAETNSTTGVGTAPMLFVVGSGGAGLNETTETDGDAGTVPLANSRDEVKAHGVLKLWLRPHEFDYEFKVPGLSGEEAGIAKVTDASCVNDD
jgi:hypothetical protein